MGRDGGREVNAIFLGALVGLGSWASVMSPESLALVVVLLLLLAWMSGWTMMGFDAEKTA